MNQMLIRVTVIVIGWRERAIIKSFYFIHLSISWYSQQLYCALCAGKYEPRYTLLYSSNHPPLHVQLFSWGITPYQGEGSDAGLGGMYSTCELVLWSTYDTVPRHGNSTGASRAIQPYPSSYLGAKVTYSREALMYVPLHRGNITFSRGFELSEPVDVLIRVIVTYSNEVVRGSNIKTSIQSV